MVGSSHLGYYSAIHHAETLKPKISGNAQQIIEKNNARKSKQYQFGAVNLNVVGAPGLGCFPVQSEDQNVQSIGKAVWWNPDPETISQPSQGSRTLCGEIHIPRGFPPTTDFSLFSVQVSTDLYFHNCDDCAVLSTHQQYSIELLGPSTHGLNLEPQTSSRKGKDPETLGERVYASRTIQITSHLRKDEPTPISYAKDIASNAVDVLETTVR